MLARALLLFASLLPTPLLAQPTPEPPIAGGPAVWIAPAPGLQPIRLDAVSIRIQASGFLARTRIELEFHNPNGRVLEGEFVFPLGAGQTVSGYALEVEGRMREGVVVPKQTARVAFEDISRQQIDPGLAELTRGNVFRTRLYPIPANGSKRVALSFEQRMPMRDDHYQYLLPLAFRAPVGRFSVRAEAGLGADGGGGAVASPDPALRFDRSGEAWVASFTRENIQPQRELAFRIPRRAGEVDALAAADPLEPGWVSVVAQLDSERPAQLKAARPGRIALYFDASGSARGRDLAREREALGRYLATLGEIEVQLVAFRDAAEAPRRFRLRGGDPKALLDALAALPLDGGSSYGAIDLGQLGPVDLVLVLGDGLSNFGSHLPRTAQANGRTPRLHVLHAAQEADPAALARLVRPGGGRVLDLLRLDPEEVERALAASPWRLHAIEASGGRCEHVLPAAPTAVGDLIEVSARCEPGATLRLRLGQDGPAQVSRELAVADAARVEGELVDTVHRLHAQARINELEAAARPDEAAITALATAHAVVTRFTSLLVLDRIEDYLRYRIEPREDDLRAQYRARLPELAKPVADPGREQRLQKLVALWKDFSGWHGSRHPWLETLLQPTAEAEAAAWAPYARSEDPTLRQRASEAAALLSRSQSLASRWSSVGANPKARGAWEQEATETMLAVDALRNARAALGPLVADAAARAEGAGAAGEMAVSGARIAEADRERRVMAEAPMPAPLPAPMIAPQSPATPASVSTETANAEIGGAKADEPAASPPLRSRISLRGWNPDTPYLREIRSARAPYEAYLAQRELHADSPSFFLDAADYFRTEGKSPVLAQRVLSNLAEIGSENTALVRILGYRLAQWGDYALAVGQFEEALLQRPEEPQSYRDLALALARQQAPPLGRAVELLWQVAIGDWHGRFPDIELIALHELNDLLAQAGASERAEIARLGIPEGLLTPLPVGLRVVMTWDADNTDIDLWVVDPAGESTYYGQNRSRSGGHVSRDFTQGYGPEVYTIARPLPGTYRIRAHYFGDRRQSLTGPVTVQVEFQTGFGTAGTQREAITRRLETGREWIDLGEFSVGGN